MAENRIQRYRIFREQKDIHRNRIAGRRTISFHSGDPIHDIQARFDGKVQIRQHSRENIRVGILSMSHCLVHSADTSVLIFHGSGDPLQCVCFHFADTHQGIGFQNVFCQGQSSSSLRLYSLLVLKFFELHTVFFQRRVHMAFFHCLARAADSTGISAGKMFISLFTENPEHIFHHRRISHNRPLPFCGPHQVRFEQDFLILFYQ